VGDIKVEWVGQAGEPVSSPSCERNCTITFARWCGSSAAGLGAAAVPFGDCCAVVFCTLTGPSAVAMASTANDHNACRAKAVAGSNPPGAAPVHKNP